MLKKIIIFIKSLFRSQETFKHPDIDFHIDLKKVDEIINDFPVLPEISHTAFTELPSLPKKKRVYKKKEKK
jgi:hypothetical protein